MTEESVREAFLATPGMEAFFLYGAEWLTLQIKGNSRLRMLVPRVYGLGDLSQILDERGYKQAQAILFTMGDELGKIVITDAYRKSANALREHGFVLLLGQPASGKSTIAASLAVGAIDSLGCSTLKIQNAEEFVQHWNPEEPRQFFWVDDAFGATQYQKGAALEWSRIFPHLQTAVTRGARVLFTSRDYIYRAARQDLKTGAFPLLNESQVVIHVQELTTEEKGQILYNHVKLGNQPRTFKIAIKPFLPAIAESKAFLPEVARRLGNSLFTVNLHIEKNSVLDFVEKPLVFLLDVLRGLDSHSRASLALIFMNGGSLQSPMSLTEDENRALHILGSSSAAVRESLHAMNGSLVKYIRGETPCWMFQHPTVLDALASMIAEDPELLDIYLAGTPTETLLREVTCGDVGISGARVIIPPSRYMAFCSRLQDPPKDYRAYDRKCLFLAYRCNAEFLKTYLNEDPEILESISRPGSFLSACSDVSLLVRLHELGLLPEAVRAKFVEGVRELAVDTPDADFLSGSIRDVFLQSEIDEILYAVRQRLLPKLREGIRDWDFSRGKEEPRQYFEPLMDALEAYEREFKGEVDAENMIHDALELIASRIAEIEQGRPDLDPERQPYSYREEHYSQPGERSIFDDVDT
ncbi:MAG TPA: hypothetical protein VFI02_00130 [Armatimonadota bacterium]|nr:hypothetical protein [Armatimonadota bacterium]